MAKHRNVERIATEKEIARHKQLRKTVEDNDQWQIRELIGKQAKDQADELIQIFLLLKAERQRQSMSLTQLATLTGIDKGRLSRLENSQHPNVTIETLVRISQALGKRITLKLEDVA